METCVHFDEAAPKRERWRVLRKGRAQKWITIESFGTERDANAFARGFALGTAYAAAPVPLPERIDTAVELLKAARDDYKRECRELRAQLRGRVI